jgi:hypothetical protein
MTVRLLVCLELACDACGRALDDGCSEIHFQAFPGMSSAARAAGWTSDGHEMWHCTECPELLDEEAGAPPIPDGQLTLTPDRGGINTLECRLRRAGYLPWLGRA